MTAYYQIEGTPLRRASEVTKAYPDDDKHDRIKDWCVRVGIVDLCRKLETWDAEDAHGQIKKIASGADGWKDLVEAHAMHHRDELSFRGQTGTAGHALIDAALIKDLVTRGIAPPEAVKTPDFSGEPVAFQDRAVMVAMSWAKWWEQRAKPSGFTVLASELKLMSKSLGLGGTVDCIARFNGKDGTRPGLWVFDWKSGRIDYTGHAMQCVGYTALAEAEAVLVDWDKPHGGYVTSRARAEEAGVPTQPVKIEGQAIVHCSPEKASFAHYEVPAQKVEPLWRMFVRCLEILEAREAFEKETRGMR